MLSQFMHAPTSTHWGAVKHLLCYLNGTRDHGISLQANSPLSLHCCTDADWLAILTAALLSGLILFFLGPTQSFSLPPSSYLWLVPPLKLSIAILLLPLIADLQWTRSVLMELGISLSSPQVIFYGNVGATYLSSNPVFHSRMKHIATDFHFVRDLVKLSLRLSQVFSAE